MVGRIVPPFTIADDTVMISIHLFEELVESGVRHGDPRFCKGLFEFIPIQLPIVISIYTLEKVP